VVCSTAAFVSTQRAKADALGYFTLTENALKPDGTLNCVRLLIGRLPTTSTTAQREARETELIGHGLAPADRSGFPRSITIGTQTLYRVTRGTLVVQSVNPVVVTSSTGIVTVGASGSTLRRYRGKGEARINSAALLAGINELPVEDYLYGVVPQELGPVQYPEMEAQKAQAVAARTYALAGLNKRAADGYDLRATTDDQVYGGYGFEHPVSNQAVDETRGVVATYDAKLIAANFSSTSGGHTADSEESFGGVVVYQRGVPDAQRGAAFEHVPTLEVFRAHANPQSLRALKEGDFESDWARYHRWTFEWTAAEIRDVVAASIKKPVTVVHEINALSRGRSGRVLELEYVTDAGRDTVRKDAIRASLKYINDAGTAANLLSTLFFVEPVKERGQLTGGFRVYGGGFGHGVGLAQTGAVGMAQKGHTYEEILKHYYQGIAVEAWY
jgi:stage II sporulation protein D